MAGSVRFAVQERVALAGSEKQPFLGGAARGSLGAVKSVRVSVSVAVRPRQALVLKKGQVLQRMTRAGYARQHGANPTSVRLVRGFAAEFGLSVDGALSAGPCMMKLSGSVAAMERAFGVKLQQHTSDGGVFRVREGSIYLPAELEGHVLAVLGLDNRPQAQAHFRVAVPHESNVSYTPVQVGKLYGFPEGATAAGQTIGLVELGGGFRAADIKAYFHSLGLTAPTVTAFAVDGAKNKPGSANGADGEVMLDIEVAGAVAVGAKIVVYFAPNTDQGFINAVSTAVHDAVNKPSVVSISWGGPESRWTGQATAALDAACQAAAAVGVTITVACGDDGSTDGATGNNVDFPASSPHVLACGGTKLMGSGATIVSEVVWNELASGEGATGGGVSTVFALPGWQQKAGVPASTTAAGGRGVPDVAGDADPSAGYVVRVDGKTMVIGGTSAVAPLWAGLIALANQQNGVAAGFVNPALYGAGAKKAFRDITSGNNGSFSAGPGWDACTGLGSPVGTAVVAALGTGSLKKRKK